MPRNKRTKSYTNVYHVIIRGINKQDIFLDKQDFLKFKEEIKNTKDKYKYELYAYALMSDHVHFIFHDNNENMSVAIQSLNVRYSAYYNKKYERTGHLFENRYKSKVIEDAGYLRNLVRYIHKNPENAGLKPYMWTSYDEYIGKQYIIESSRVLKLFGDNKKKTLDSFKEFHENYYRYQDIANDFELLTKITDEEAIFLIKNILSQNNLLKIQSYNKEDRNKAIAKILKIEGISKKQISRITGINRKTISIIEKNTQK